MKMDTRKILSIFFLFITFSSCIAKVEKSYVRLQANEPGERKIVSLMNSDQIVNLVLEKDGTIVDCHVYRRKELLLKILKYEEENHNEDSNVERFHIDLDVPWYARKCRKHLRDTARTGDRTDPLVAEILDRQSLDKAMSGTQFCTRMASTWNSELDYPDLEPTDRCCQSLHSCTYSIQPFHFRKGAINVMPYFLYSCECLQEFKDCLDQAKPVSTLATEVNRKFFDILQIKCFDIVDSTKCKKYSTWFDQCQDADEKMEMMKIRKF